MAHQGNTVSASVFHHHLQLRLAWSQGEESEEAAVKASLECLEDNLPFPFRILHYLHIASRIDRWDRATVRGRHRFWEDIRLI